MNTYITNHMDDIKRALLGDQEAARRMTEAGVLIPCPGCGGNNTKICYVCGDHFGMCKTCGWTGPMRNTDYDASLAWNTRAPILSKIEMERLEGME